MIKNTISINQKIDRLVVLDVSHKQNRFTFYKCQCECGQIVVRRKDHLLRTKNQSCGCLRCELTKQRFTKHGLSGSTPEYQAWAHMKRRCYTPTTKGFKDYGGRGITVCERWLNSFENFIADLGFRPSDKHSLDRINVNGNYTPDNCRWATTIQQVNNKRTNRLLSYQGETLTAAEWSERLGFGRGVILSRLKLGWSVERALSTRPRKS